MKKTKIILLLCLILVFTLAVALLVGCNRRGAQYEYDHLVTFDYNVDNLGVATNCKDQYLGVKDGGKIIAPGYNDKFELITVNNYYNRGWFKAVLDEQGNPVKDGQGNIVLADEPWNFDEDVVHESMTLYADFHKNPTLTVKVDGGQDIVVTRKPGETYNKPLSSSNKPQKDGYTFIDYYTDQTYTTKFQFPYVFTDEDEVCYALMLEGTWDIVTNGTSFRSALQRNHSMFIEAPNGEINLEDVYFRDGQFNLGYSGKIYGHGCTLKNINISTAYNRSTKETDFSLFGNLASSVVMQDVTFENIKFEVNVSSTDTPDLHISLFASDIKAGVQLNNVKFANCVLNYAGSTAFTIEKYGYYVTGGEAYECFDSAQLTIQRDGVVVE